MVFRGDWIPQNGCFFGKVPRGGVGVISDPKNYIADFGILNDHFRSCNIRKNRCRSPKGGGVKADPKKFIADFGI